VFGAGSVGDNMTDDVQTTLNLFRSLSEKKLFDHTVLEPNAAICPGDNSGKYGS